MAQPARTPSSVRPTAFVVALGAVLAGYMLLDRPFAYLHVPGTPLFVGELVLGLGIVAVLRGSGGFASVRDANPSIRPLLALLVIASLRVLWDLPTYGVTAVRDSAILYYAAYALLVAVVLIEQPGTLSWLVKWYRRVAVLVILWAPFGMVLSRLYGLTAPLVPDSTITWLALKPGNLALHSAAAISFIWLMPGNWFSKHRGWKLALSAAAIGDVLIGAALNRGSGLGSLAIISMAILLSRDRIRDGTIVMGLAALVIGLALVFGFSLDTGRRQVSIGQLIANSGSLTAVADAEGNLGDTVEWRLTFWAKIAEDTLWGDRALTGWGFGPNIAEIYGYNTRAVGAEGGLRSAHNSHMSVVGRLGLAGASLWLLFWLMWFSETYREARRERDLGLWPIAGWAMSVAAGLMLAAVFDPMFESPQVGVWLWTLVAVGFALRATPDIRPAGIRHGLLLGD